MPRSIFPTEKLFFPLGQKPQLIHLLLVGPMKVSGPGSAMYPQSFLRKTVWVTA